MMRLGTMGMLAATLDERGASPIANAIAARWEHDSGTVRFFRASANFLFVFKNRGQNFVLRFVKADERSATAIRAELDLMRHLVAKGIHVPKPIPSLAKRWVELVETEQGSFYAVVFERLPGEQYELEELTVERIVRWGRALGELHNAAQGYADAVRPTWQDQLEFVAAGLPPTETAARATLARVRAQLAAIPVRPDNFGLIHFDFEVDNLIWDGSRVGIVDFDDCAHGWFAADVAFALRDVFGDRADKVNLHNEMAQSFVEGYRSVRRIDNAELERIPLFLELHNLVTLVKLFHSLTPDAAQDEAAWLTELRAKLRRKIVYYREGFEGENRDWRPEL